MTQQVEARLVVADERGDAARPEGDNQFNMVQGIRREIAEMLAAKKRGFSVDDYYHLAEVGILHEDDRVELIGGEIVVMSPINGPHAAGVKALNREFGMKLSGRAIVSVQDPIHLNDNTEPQPDIALLRPRGDLYAAGHATPDDVFLIVEVAESSVSYDRNEKLPRYARARIPEVWIANLRDDSVERYRSPIGDEYRDVSQFTRDDTISPELLPDVELAIDDILPQGSA